jgi:hypothetical protein
MESEAMAKNGNQGGVAGTGVAKTQSLCQPFKFYGRLRTRKMDSRLLRSLCIAAATCLLLASMRAEEPCRASEAPKQIAIRRKVSPIAVSRKPDIVLKTHKLSDQVNRQLIAEARARIVKDRTTTQVSLDHSFSINPSSPSDGDNLYLDAETPSSWSAREGILEFGVFGSPKIVPGVLHIGAAVKPHTLYTLMLDIRFLGSGASLNILPAKGGGNVASTAEAELVSLTQGENILYLTFEAQQPGDAYFIFFATNADGGYWYMNNAQLIINPGS